MLLSDCDSVRRPNFPEKDSKKYLACSAGEGVYIRQEPLAKMAFFKVDLKIYLKIRHSNIVDMS